MIVQRNLPLGVEYNLVDSWQAGLEAGNVCANCGAVISNCAELESGGKRFIVGMDCAKTLCGDSLYVLQAESAFQQGKQARARIKKAIKNKEGVNFGEKTYSDANNFWKETGAGCYFWTLPTGGTFFKSFPAKVWQSHVLPMIKDLLSNSYNPHQLETINP